MAQAGSAAPQSKPVDLEAAHDALLRRGDLQFDFPPSEIAAPRGQMPDWLAALGEIFAPLFQILFWGVLALVILGIIYLIVRELGWVDFSRKRRKSASGAQADLYRPEESVARALLEDADRLAQDGRYAEAAHILLLRSIEDMQRFRPRAVKPAATSRDISRLDVLPEKAREAFMAMARLVETSLFGGRDVDAGAYAECRAAYEAFAFPRVWT